MAAFKTTQFEILTAVVNRISTRLNDSLKEHSIPLIISNQIINTFVNEMCKEFAIDNPRFNETLFRSQCGNHVSKENVNG